MPKFCRFPSNRLSDLRPERPSALAAAGSTRVSPLPKFLSVAKDLHISVSKKKIRKTFRLFGFYRSPCHFLWSAGLNRLSGLGKLSQDGIAELCRHAFDLQLQAAEVLLEGQLLVVGQSSVPAHNLCFNISLRWKRTRCR